MSGNQETAVSARHSSISSADVPIKKRRFPMFQPNSPPQEELSSHPVERSSSLPTQKDSGAQWQESSRVNASVVTSSILKSDPGKNEILEVKKESSSETNSSCVTSEQESLNIPKAKLPQLRNTFDSRLPENVDSKEKINLLMGKAKENVQLQTELHLTPTGKEAVNKQVLGTEFKLGLPNISEGSVLSFKKEPTALAGQTDESRQVCEKLNPSSLSLSLGKEKSSALLESNHVTSRKEDGLVNSNRCNWDLNTTMDAWESSVVEATIPKNDLFTGLNEIGGTGSHDTKSFFSMQDSGDVRGKQIVDAGEHISTLPTSLSSNKLYKSEDSLHLSLSTSFSQPNVRAEVLASSAKTNLAQVLPSSNVPGVLGSTGIKNAVICPIVKQEPRDDTAKNVQVGNRGNAAKPDHVGVRAKPGILDHIGDRGNLGLSDSIGGRVGPTELLDSRTIKREMAEKCNTGTNKLPTVSCTSVEPKHIKSEPIQEGNREQFRILESTLIGNNAHRQDNRSLSPTHSQPQSSCVSSELVTQANLSVSGEAPNMGHAAVSSHEEHERNTDIPQEGSINVGQTLTEKVSESLNQESKELYADVGTSNAFTAENTQVDGPGTSSVNVMVEAPNSACVGGDESEDEKVNISNDMIDEDPYDSDMESDGNKAILDPVDTHQRKNGKEDDDYEDGEVRDPLAQAAAAADGSAGEEAKNITVANCSNDDSKSISFCGDDSIIPSPSDVKDSKAEDCGEINDALMNESTNTSLDLRSEHIIDNGSSLQESVRCELLTDGADRMMPLNAVCAPGECGKSDLEMDCDTETFSNGANNGGQESEMAFVEAADEITRVTDATSGIDSTLPKTEEAPANINDTSKDSNTGANRSRIINLPRGTNVTPPYKTRSFPERSFGRERYTDFDEERIHPRRNRDEFYADGPRKFLRDRYQGQSFRNHRQSYGRGRGRGYGRSDSSRTEWDSDRIFVPRNYNGQNDFRFPRHKRNSAVGDEELECNGYLLATDGDLVGSGRIERKSIDELPSFRHPSSRRMSPGARDGRANRGVHVLRRVPRNISPSRCGSEDGSELAGPRHGKFVRDDIMDPIFTRNQPPFERLDRQFGRGGRNFSSGQRRGGLRVRSKSPIRSRTRSPGPWSSPRRRSPDGFNGVSEYSQRRSPIMFRKERIRSPNLPCSPDEISDRRRGSPSYITRPSNRRSSPDRVMPRSNRRFDSPLESRERTDSDGYTGGGPPPLRTGKFHEVSGDGNGDDRRTFGERRGIVRPPFRASGGGSGDNDNFRSHPDDSGPPPPRSFRSSPEADMFERNNGRERDFDRRLKNRPLIQPRRIEQDGNFRQQGSHVWHDEGFEDNSQTKRRRF